MRYSFILLLVLLSTAVFAQKQKIDGQVLDSLSNSPLPNALISISAGNFKTNVIADSDGSFSIKDIKKGKYQIEVSFLSYKKFQSVISIGKENLNLGKILLKQEDQNINEVNVVGQITPVNQKGDTTEMSAISYKVNTDADALDLVKKMPGITVENGKVKAHGEELKRVMVDGKNFFGDDVSLSLQNISSDMIEKVQIYNKLSDQSEFIGFDDGNSEKVMNIITRPDRRTGQNGKLSAGYGLDDVYQVSGRWNFSDKKNNLTITGGTNNVNQQNFSMGSGPPSSGQRGGSAFYGRSSGLNTINSIGTNYSGNLTPKIKLSASYFFNNSQNLTISNSNTELFGDIDTMFQARYGGTFTDATKNNFNHRINATLEYQIDSLNSLIYRQNFSFQQSDQNSMLNSMNFNQSENPMLQTLSNNLTYSVGYNYSGNFTLRHKFMKNGRTVSLGLQFAGNQQDGDNTNISNSETVRGNTDIYQTSNSTTNGKSYSANLVYTEPITKNFLIMLSYNAGKNPNNTDRFVYDNFISPRDRIDSISNSRESNYMTQKAGLSFLLQKGKDLNASVGVELQNADLTGDQTYPYNYKTSKSFRNILPNARLNYKINKQTNIRVNYSSYTSAPSITQLQPVIDITNSSSFYLGNPNLGQEYTHGLFTNFKYANSEKFTNFGFNIFGNYTIDPIGKETQIMEKDTMIHGQVLLQNGQLVSLVNLPDAWNIRGFVNYGFLFKPIKCNLSFNAGAGYATMPGIFNKILSTTKSVDYSGGLVIASNISQYVDFTISYNVNNTISDNSIEEKLNSNYWRHTIGLSSTLTSKKGIVFSNSLSEQIIRGLGTDYNQDYLIWNISLGKKIFKNKSGQIAVQVNDILDQNKDISRTVTNYYVADYNTNTMGRYSMLVFTYTLKAYSSKNKPDDRFGPGGGFDDRRHGPPDMH